jgi:hypothetical protein
MRRVVSSTMVTVGLVLGGPMAAMAAPSPPPSGAAAGGSGGARVCTITDDRLVELSGMVATADGFVVVNDSSDQLDRKRIFFLDKQCEVTDAKSYSGGGPRDPEDLGLSPDGKTLYIADIGDNEKSRSTVALWTMPPDGSEPPVINRLTYPDGKHDAEALLFNGDGTPIIVTREPGKAGLYSPTGPLQPDTREGVPLKKLGEVRWPRTTTVNEFLGPLAQMVITGGATAPDGSKVVLRTYSDAFEWDVTGGDVVAALTKGKPQSTSLPGEPRGESITYGPDGKSFLTVSEVADQPAGTQPEIRRYTPSRQATAALKTQGKANPDDRSWFAKLSLQDITYMIGAVGVVGALLLGAGVFGIVRARRAGVTPGDDGEAGDGLAGRGGGAVARVSVPQDAMGQLDDGFPVAGGGGPDRYPPARRPSGAAGRTAGAVYGGGPPPGAVYGTQPPRGGTYGSPRGGSVYGGGNAGGGYGGDSSGGGFDDSAGPSGNGYGSATGRYSGRANPDDRLGR